MPPFRPSDQPFLFGLRSGLLDLLRARRFGGERHGFGLEFHREREKIGNDWIIRVDDRSGQTTALFRFLAEVVGASGVAPSSISQANALAMPMKMAPSG